MMTVIPYRVTKATELGQPFHPERGALFDNFPSLPHKKKKRVTQRYITVGKIKSRKSNQSLVKSSLSNKDKVYRKFAYREWVFPL